MRSQSNRGEGTLQAGRSGRWRYGRIRLWLERRGPDKGCCRAGNRENRPESLLLWSLWFSGEGETEGFDFYSDYLFFFWTFWMNRADGKWMGMICGCSSLGDWSRACREVLLMVGSSERNGVSMALVDVQSLKLGVEGNGRRRAGIYLFFFLCHLQVVLSWRQELIWWRSCWLAHCLCKGK